MKKNNSKEVYIQKTILAYAENIAQFFLDTPPATILSLIIFSGLFVIILTLLAFGYLSDTVLDKERIFFDSYITDLVISFRSPTMTTFMMVITNLGSYGVSIGSIFILFFLFLKKHIKEAILFVVIVLMGGVINVLLKLIVQRVRPDTNPLLILTDYSFPSGHSMSSFIFFATIAYFAYHFTKNKKVSIVIALFCFFLIFLIGISRIYLGVHYPSDVLGGYIAGALWYATIIVFDRTLTLYRLFREYSKNAYDNRND